MKHMRSNHPIRGVRAKIQVLEDFCIPISDDMISSLENLYPNEIDMENYTRSIIMNYFDEREGKSR